MYPPRRPVIQTYEDAGHGGLAGKVLDRKSVIKARPKMRESLKNFTEMITTCVENLEEPVEMESHSQTIIYKNIFIY